MPPAATSLTELQQQLDLYDGAYNALRPHQALDGRTPDERYAERHTTSDNNDDTPPEPPLPVMRDVKASVTGAVAIGRSQHAQVGVQWQHARLTVFRDGDRVAIFHRDHLVRALDADPTRRYQPLGSRPGGCLRPRIALPASSLPAAPAEARSGHPAAPAAPARTNDVDGTEPRHTITTHDEAGPHHSHTGVSSDMS